MSEEKDWLRGERGAKGDHGQPGDEGSTGATGDVGVPGAPGAPGTPGAAGASGAVGERGRAGAEGAGGKTGAKGLAGRNAPSNWVAYIIMGLTLILAAVVFVSDRNADQKAAGKSVLQNCQQIEVVKTQLRQTVQASVDRLPQIAYYREHPGELRAAIKSAEASVVRFAPRDCYGLPTVKVAGIKPPQK